MKRKDWRAAVDWVVDHRVVDLDLSVSCSEVVSLRSSWWTMRGYLNSRAFRIDGRLAVANYIKCFDCREYVVMALHEMIGVRGEDSHGHYAVPVGLDSGLKSIAVGHLL